MLRLTCALFILCIHLPAVTAAGAFDARARGAEDLRALAVEDINDIIATSPIVLPLPTVPQPPGLGGTGEHWPGATRIDLGDLVRVEGLGLPAPTGVYEFALDEGDLLVRTSLPDAGERGDLVAIVQAEKPLKQQGSVGKDTKDGASGGEVLGSNFGGGAAHFAEYELAAAEGARDAVLWFRVARASEGTASWTVSCDGTPLPEPLRIEPTGGWNTFRWLPASCGDLQPGVHAVRAAGHSRWGERELRRHRARDAGLPPPGLARRGGPPRRRRVHPRAGSRRGHVPPSARGRRRPLTAGW